MLKKICVIEFFILCSFLLEYVSRKGSLDGCCLRRNNQTIICVIYIYLYIYRSIYTLGGLYMPLLSWVLFQSQLPILSPSPLNRSFTHLKHTSIHRHPLAFSCGCFCAIQYTYMYIYIYIFLVLVAYNIHYTIDAYIRMVEGLPYTSE